MTTLSTNKATHFLRTPFGRFDEFRYRQFEASAVTDSAGFYEISNLFPNDYEVVYFDNPNNPILSGAQSVPISVTKYENFVLGPNDVPDAEDLAATIDENSAFGTFVGGIVASGR